MVEKTTYSLDMSLEGFEESHRGPEIEEIREFYEFLIKLDERVQEEARANKGPWLTNPRMKDELVDSLIRSTVRFSIDKDNGEIKTDYAPNVKARVTNWGGKFQMDVYDEE